MDYQEFKVPRGTNANDLLGRADTLPHEIRDIARCRSPIIVWTMVDEELDIDLYVCCNKFGIFVMPCLWPHLVLVWPCLCCAAMSEANSLRSQYWILTETELKVVSQSYDVCCNTGCRTSGDSVQTIPLENITDCGIQARPTGCLARCVAPVPTIYIDTAASVTPDKIHEATGVALVEYEALIQAVLTQRDVVKGWRPRGSGAGQGTAVHAMAVMERGDRTAAERIREVTELHQAGILTQAEYDTKRQQIIDSI